MTIQVLTTWLAGPAGESLLALLGSWTLRGGLVLAATVLVATLLRKRSAALRHAIWGAGLAAFVLVPALAGVVPDWRLELLPRPATTTAPGPAAEMSGGASAVPVLEPPHPPGAGSFTPAPIGPAPRARSGGALALGVWIAGVAFGVARLGMSHARLAFAIRRARPVTDPAWISSLREGADAVGLTRDVTLSECAAIRVPIACGFTRLRVLLPPADRAPDAAARRAVMIHELGHLRRGDAAWQLGARLVHIFFWFHPLVWLAVHRLRSESELACDDGVLRSGERPSSYAATLLAFASGGREPATALAFVGAGGLERRITAVLAARRDRLPLSRLARVSVGAGAALVALVLSLPVLVPARAEPGSAGERRAAEVRNEPGAPVELRSATVRVRPAAQRWTDGAPLGPEVRIDAPLLELANHGRRAVSSVLVRLETRHLSRDLMWEEVRVPAGGGARLMLPPDLWSHQGPRASAERFAISIAAVRFDDRTEWWGTETKRPLTAGFAVPDADAPTPTFAKPKKSGTPAAKASPEPVVAPARTVAPSPTLDPPARTTPAPGAPSADAPDPVLAPGPPYDDWPGDRTNAHPVRVLETSGAPIAIEDAFTPDLDTEPNAGKETTNLPYLGLRNLTSRRIVAVKLRFKADPESHAVTNVRRPIEPGSRILYHRDLVVWGRPEKMTAQVIGVRFEGGETWGSFDSTIDARDPFIPVGDR